MTVIAEFTDRFGRIRKVHKKPNGRLAVQRLGRTPALVLNQSIAGLVGQRIREQRRKVGMSLEELCLAAGLVATSPKARMWEIENAQRKDGIRLGTLYAIAAAMGIEAKLLLPTVREVLTLADVEEVQVSRLVVNDASEGPAS